jgi:putative ABC transport system permease protein
MALETMGGQKLRSALTMLGVVIGVASVITVAAIIDGLNAHIKGKLEEIGNQSFFITRFKLLTARFDRLPEEIRIRKYFKAEDAEAIRQGCPSVDHAIAMLTRAAFMGNYTNDIRYKGNQVGELFLRGAPPELLDVLPVYRIHDGRMFTHEEDRRAMQVCIVGNAIARSLFGAEDPLEREVRVNGILFRVIGVFEPHQGLFNGPGVDEFVIVPYHTFAKLYPEIEEVMLVASVSDAARLESAQGEVREVMRRRRKVPSYKADDFEITSPDLLVDLWDSLTSAIVALTLVIASIALIVGGIGVMNIMLVSVTERTSEIGVRKALGARRKDIAAQFLIEAITLTTTGGLVGVLVGIGASVAVALLVPALPAEVSPFWTVAGLLLSVLVGLFFGMYPAMIAAGLDPVRSLRYE